MVKIKIYEKEEIIIFKSLIGNIIIKSFNKKISRIHTTNKKIQISKNNQLINAKEEILDYLSKKRKLFSIPLDINGTDFQKSVWNETSKIPYGETTTYLNISNILKSSPRAVGQACKQNPILLIIPCHRVISKSSTLTGFSAVGGIEIKKKLLNIENTII